MSNRNRFRLTAEQRRRLMARHRQARRQGKAGGVNHPPPPAPSASAPQPVPQLVPTPAALRALPERAARLAAMPPSPSQGVPAAVLVNPARHLAVRGEVIRNANSFPVLADVVVRYKALPGEMAKIRTHARRIEARTALTFDAGDQVLCVLPAYSDDDAIMAELLKTHRVVSR